MSLTRSFDDKCAIQGRMGVSSGVSNYVLDTTRNVPSNPCTPDFGVFTNVTRNMPVSRMVDFESNIFGLNNKLSKCGSNVPPCSNMNRNGMYCDGKPQSFVLNTCSIVDTPNKNTFLGFRL